MRPTDRIGGDVTLYRGDCLAVLPTLAAGSVDAVVTDPPYGLGFMGKEWDHGVPGVGFWSAVLRVLRPAGYLVAMGGTRTYHRLVCAIEDAGFEPRDCIMWLYGSGFPKGQGCLKPAYEPILLARKPGPKVLPLGIDGCRIECEPRPHREKVWNGTDTGVYGSDRNTTRADGETSLGRWPANVLHDGSDEVMEAFAAFGERASGKASADGHRRNQPNGFGTVGDGIYGGGKGLFTEAGPAGALYGDSGSAARFFYCAKVSPEERGDNRHPTVKPLALMRWVCRLVTPKGGKVLDPFLGSGSTLVAAMLEGFGGVGIEREEAYYATALTRLRHAAGESADQLFSVTAGAG